MASSWKLERYARYVTNIPGGHWQYYDDAKEELRLTLTDSDHLVLFQGYTVMESLSLKTSKAWMRGMVKTDSMLLMYKVQVRNATARVKFFTPRILNLSHWEETRRFSVKFHASDPAIGKAICDDCLQKLANYFPIKMASESQTSLTSNSIHDMTDYVKGEKDGEKKKEMVSTLYANDQKKRTVLQGQNVSSIAEEKPENENKVKKLSGDVTLGQIAEVVTGKVNTELPAAYQQCNVSKENISTMVRLCLTDPAFPAFVDSVEQELNKIMAESKT
ncbi:meiotic recombination protein REC114-like [Gigantopelta aegis]|uniref:meiotic recombination protein REC114-like n=1 Tax=Gigantopelta aegis TaxID=1735272 RepID=UPI001B888E81|nr:meiotic recombination protein REC114-like [Gigantopelta aegis]